MRNYQFVCVIIQFSLLIFNWQVDYNLSFVVSFSVVNDSELDRTNVETSGDLLISFCRLVNFDLYGLHSEYTLRLFDAFFSS